ncbi:RNA polymerase sigma factor [Methylophilus sp. TWE2]|uniref:RNA polymerase sigma factor n=1 Tax=Methylophilus sp. TWE2 TaxID=1662285 RepID=UPI001E49E2C7|nr:sigma-70 family RNA polymerase sigma factor [Methylophilus sp. TWE2]
MLSSLVLHYGELVNHVNHHFGSRHFAEDVVHDVCIQLMENPPVTEIRAPLSYLRKVSMHRALDRTRHEKVGADYLAKLPDGGDSHFYDGAAALEFAQKIAQIKQMIEALPRKQRQVFLLHQLHEIPQHEIAVKMGISANMVSRHFNKALASITIARKQLSF